MKIQVKIVLLMITFIMATGCAGFMHHSDPLTGWKADLDHEPDQAVVKDYQSYIQKLPPQERNHVGPVFYLEDETGQHAISVEIFVKGKNASWHHAIFYDKENKRIKAIKYGYSRYQS